MYDLFGILKRNLSPYSEKEHLDSIRRIQEKFPRQTTDFELIERSTLILFGKGIQSCRENHIEVFWIGELFNHAVLRLYLGKDTPQNSSEAELAMRLIQKGGRAAIGKINGSFNLIVLDHRSKQIELLNDQMGIRQVFYHVRKDFVLIGSELKFILSHPSCPKEIDWQQSLKRPIPFIVLHGEQNHNAWFRDIHLLNRATAMTITSESSPPEQNRYWKPENFPNDPSFKRPEEVQEAYFSLLQDAVAIRSADTNTAYGMLSGGLDSSVIAALIAKNQSIETFSAMTQATFTDGSTSACLELAKACGFHNTQLLLPYDRFSQDATLWKQRIWRSESPVVHKDALAKTLLHAAISRYHPEASWLLSGTGSDQLNGGLVRWIAEEEADHSENNWTNIRQAIQEERFKYAIPQHYDAYWGSRGLLHSDFIQSISTLPAYHSDWHFYMDCNLHANQFALLWDEHRAGYSHNRKMRFPFMDYRFLELLLAVPEPFHSGLFYDKQILRRPSQQLLPDFITQQPKAPGSHRRRKHRIDTYQKILRGNFLEEALSALSDQSVIDRDRLQEKIRQLHTQPDSAEWEYVMNIINLALLSKLPEQDEQSMNYEDPLMNEIQWIPPGKNLTSDWVAQQLSIETEKEILHRPLHFGEACTLVEDAFTKTAFLVQEGCLSYELEAEYQEWKQFLLAIDNQRSAKEICEALQLDIHSFKSFFLTCLEEEILTLNPQ